MQMKENQKAYLKSNINKEKFFKAGFHEEDFNFINDKQFSHNHLHCMLSKRDLDDNKECTHHPKLCKKSEKLIEHKVI